MKTVNGVSYSPNWSGYAVTGQTFTSVSGSWVQPTASCPTNQQQDASFWVGIDGYAAGDNAVEQIGTDSDCNKGNRKKGGGPYYYAWWEFDTATSTSSMVIPQNVAPGDQMTATVSNTGGVFTLTLTDSGPTYVWTSTAGPTTPLSAPAAASAEWIAEAPSVCKPTCVPVKLADFQSVTFTGATANGSPLGSYTGAQIHAIRMTKGRTIKAAPWGLSGSSFNINWEHN